MKKQRQTIEFTGKNFKIVDLEFNIDDVYFSIVIGSKEMLMSGNLHFNCTVEDGEYKVDNCDLMLEPFEWEHDMKSGFLNNRNTKLICEAIEAIAMLNPESHGFDMEQHENDEMSWNAELNYRIKKESCLN